MFDLSPRWRAIACILFFGSEAALIATAGMRSDRSYGFRMFPEASNITVHLSRKLADGTLERVEDGRWRTHGCDGKEYYIVWGNIIHPPAPAKLDVSIGAPYGVESEIHRAHDAMQWVLDHTREEDCETRALVAKVRVRRNGTPPYEVDLEVTPSLATAKSDEH